MISTVNPTVHSLLQTHFQKHFITFSSGEGNSNAYWWKHWTGLLQSPGSLKIQHPTSLQVGMPLVLLPLRSPFLHKGVSEMRILEASQRPRFNQRFKNRHSLDKNTPWGPTSLKCTQMVAVGPTRAYRGRGILRSDPQPGVSNSPKPP